MLVSILHISDLHRDPNDVVSNEVLLNSLFNDIEQHTTSEKDLSPPDLIVVSGDIIRGVSKDDLAASDNLKAQYEEAEKFLISLSKELVQGDRSKVIVIPGNHDVDFSRVYGSLEKIDLDSVPPEGKSQYSELLFARNSKFRWNWSNFSLYKISNQNLYDSRFEAFTRFYNSFYDGFRNYSSTPGSQYDIFDYPALGLTFLAFNSCLETDPWKRHSSVHPDCIAKAISTLRDRKYRNRLRVGVWHHSTRGGPEKDDYLDADFLQQLITHSVSLGFHGHQHKPEMLDEKYAFGGDKKINVISAGTLCGGSRALPTGRSRGFNRVMIDTELSTAYLFTRKMVNEDLQNPIWGSDGDFRRFSFQPAPVASTTGSETEDLKVAEQMIRDRNYADAAAILEPLVKQNEIAGPLLLNAFSKLNDNSGIVRVFNPPISIQEILLVLKALYEGNNIQDLRSLINSDNISNHTDPAVVHLREKYKRKLTR